MKRILQKLSLAGLIALASCSGKKEEDVSRFFDVLRAHRLTPKEIEYGRLMAEATGLNLPAPVCHSNAKALVYGRDIIGVDNDGDGNLDVVLPNAPQYITIARNEWLKQPEKKIHVDIEKIYDVLR